MAKIRVIFYKAKWGDGNLMDNLINTWTWLISSKNRTVGPYSHVEIWTANEDGVFEVICMGVPPYWRGDCWTSTMRGKVNGTVKRAASEVIKNVDRWDYCEVEIADEYDYKNLIMWMDLEVLANRGYSKRDIFKFISPIHFPDDERNICSEFCFKACSIAKILKGWGIVSPRRLAWKLVQAGYKIKQLKTS
jgi:hypothetical protein